MPGADRAPGTTSRVICPQGKDDSEPPGPRRRRDPAVPPATRRVAARPASWWSTPTSFLATARLVLPALAGGGRSTCVQACNPPDIFWPLARMAPPSRRLAVRVRPPRPVPRALSTRASARRQHARPPRPGRARAGHLPDRRPRRDLDQRVVRRRSRCDRGGKSPRDVTVVRTGPDPERKLRRRATVPALRRGRRHLVAYLGVMGPQDGVDLAVRAAATMIVHELGRTRRLVHVHGRRRLLRRPRGTARRARTARTTSSCPGRVPDELSSTVLSTADVGLSPGPEEPAQRRLHHEQDDGVHGLRAAGRRVRPQGDPGLGRRRPRYVEPNGDVTSYARAIVELCSTTREQREDHGRDRSRADRGRARLAAPAARRTSGSTTGSSGCVRTVVAARPGPGSRPCAASPAAFQQPDGHGCVAGTMTRSHRPTAGRDAVTRLRRTSSAPHAPVQLGASAPVDHRPLDARPTSPSVKDGLHPQLQRRALQLPRAARRARDAGAYGSSPIRHRGGARGLARAGVRTHSRRFRGMFAFAIYDERTGDLALARDPLGIKPLYVMPRGDGVLFASELKAYRRGRRPASSESTPRALVASTLFYFAAPRSIDAIQGVRKLPPGRGASGDRGRDQTSRHRYWDAAEVARIGGRRGPRRTWRAVLEESVRGAPRGRRARRLLPQRRSRLQPRHRDGRAPRPLDRGLHHHVPARGPASRGDARRRRLCAQDGTRTWASGLHEIEISPDVVDMLPRIVDILDEPIGDPAAINTVLMCQAARDAGVKVLLSGMGADELFGGYRKHLACVLGARATRGLPRTLRDPRRGAGREPAPGGRRRAGSAVQPVGASVS